MSAGDLSVVEQNLAVEGAVLIFLDVPPTTEFGIDMNSWNVGDRFKGVKMIPPGLHFVYYSAVSKQGDTAPRTGFFHVFKRREVLVKKWDNKIEDIRDGDLSSEELERFEGNLRELDRFLGPYPYESWKKWVSLTGYITEPVSTRMVPLNGKICSVSELIVDKPDDDVGPPDLDDPHRKLPKMSLKPGTEIRFTEFPRKRYPSGSTAAEISHHNMDLTHTLDQMISKMTSHHELLGELQMAFICFLVGQVYDAFEQWKKLVHLLCSCEEAITKLQDLYHNFIMVLYFQIGEIPQDFFVDIVTRDNFLTSTLQTFFASLKELHGKIAPKVEARAVKFKAHLTKKFKWDFDIEPDEDAPVVVENVE